jgi:SAM-dependent methyltransferase
LEYEFGLKQIKTMDKDFTRDINYTAEESGRTSFIYKHEKLMDLLDKYISTMLGLGTVLDIGERNPFTERIEARFSINIDSTQGDLDKELNTPCKGYDLVIFSHVIEHLFNPLFCLENIKLVMKPNALLIICTPIKPHYLPSGRGHFHEMDEYRFRKLMDRAGLKIIRWEKFRNGPFFADIGIRPLLKKILFKEQSFVITKIT